MVITKSKRVRDKYQAHYTSSVDIVNYMTSCLEAREGDVIWEPCGGTGDLVDAVLKQAPNSVIRVSELDEKAAGLLARKYQQYPNVNIVFEDAIDLGTLPMFDAIPKFTRIIANPPYGGWQSPRRRSQLKNRFPKLYVRDTYGVFLLHCLNLLEPEGRLVFIIPDTYLSLNRHENLRRTLLRDTTIESIALFPSNFFPGINFGWAGLSIISLRKVPPGSDATIHLIDQIAEPRILSCLARIQPPKHGYNSVRINQREIAQADHAVFVRPSLLNAIVLNKRAQTTLGTLAEVKTGFYSGHDRHWLRRADSSIPRSNGYQNINIEETMTPDAKTKPSLKGLEGRNHFIPILRGGAAHFVKETKWYVDWSTDAVAEYKRAGKNPARFQNSKFYFRQGIGVPMVASAGLSAATIDRRLFDQGIVGIFPHDNRLMLYLLGFLNTQIATVLLRRLNSTANNSANYLKNLPIVFPTEKEISEATKLVSKAIQEAQSTCGLSEATAQDIENFYNRLWCGLGS